MNNHYNFQDGCFYLTYTFMFELPISLKTIAEKCADIFPSNLFNKEPIVYDITEDKGHNTESFLALRSPQFGVSFGPFKTELKLLIYDRQASKYKSHVEKAVLLAWRVRIMRSGLGTVTFMLSKNDDWELTFNEAIAVSRSATITAPKAEEGRVYVTKDIAKVMDRSRSERWTTLFDIFKSTVGRLRSEADLRWLEVDRNLISKKKGRFFANPYVTMRLELPTGSQTISTLLSDESLVNELARVVLRVRQEWEQVNKGYLEKHMDGLCSYTPHHRYWLTIHLRSCVYIHHRELRGQRVYPTKVYPQALIDTIELLRMKWHCYAVYSTYLDEIINEMASLEKRTKLIDDIALIERIAMMRRQISTALESPLSFKRAAGSLNEIYERGIDIFRVEALESIVLEKFRMFDRLYIDVLEILRTDDLEARIRKTKRKDGKQTIVEE